MPMPVDVVSVLEFFRKNGFSEAESALREEFFEKKDVGSFDFDRFLFPMVPPLPPVRVPASFRRPEVVDGGDCSESSDEFVSLGGSSSSDICSSEFTNPYGLRSATRGNSENSSDRLSEFGTARDYHDSDIQNDMYWSEEKDESYLMTPCFSGPFSCPSEDKFVMSLATENQSYNPSGLDDSTLDSKINYSDKPCVLNEIQVTDYHQFEEIYSNKNPFNKVLGEVDIDNDYDYGLKTEIKGMSDLNIRFDDEKNFQVLGESHETEAIVNEEEGIVGDEVVMHDDHEDEYEVFDLRIIHRKNRTGFEENKDLPIVLNTIIAGRYYVTEYLGSAAFSKVVQAHDLQMGVDVCLKIIKNDKDFFDQSLDEIKLLKYVNKYDPSDEHHILRLYDYFYHQEHLFIVCELLRANLYEFQRFNKESGGEPYFTLVRLQLITRQCLEALVYLHHLGIIHCDLKPENILIKSYRRCEIKVIDLGSSCFQTDTLSLYVQSRSYRAPEVILGLPYDQKIDIWSLGCILAELFSGEVLFPNDALAMVLARMIALIGPIDARMLMAGQETHKYFTEEYDLYHINEETNQMEYLDPGESSLEHHLQVCDTGFIEFLKDLLDINPERRPTAMEALQHPWLSYPYQSTSC